MKIFKRALIILPIIALAVLIFTNPSAKDFKEFLGKDSYKGLQRQSNYFIYSKYRDNSSMGYGHRRDDMYTGILGNFYLDKPWTPPKGEVELVDSTLRDSSKTDTAPLLPPPPPKKDPLGILIKKDPFKEFGGKRIDTIGYTKGGLPILSKK
nr:hypothetical protein [uncultured Mucilaginibacter sp.]